MMEKYFVGEVDTNTLPAQVTSNNSVRQPTQAPPAYNNQSSGFVVKMLQYIVPLLILAFAFGLQYYGKKTSPLSQKIEFEFVTIVLVVIIDWWQCCFFSFLFGVSFKTTSLSQIPCGD